ncbi:MAG: cell wall hydrolase [Limnochordia bacterium]
MPISEGRFLVEDLTPGEYTLTIQGPYRTPQTLTVSVKPGSNQLEAAVPCWLSPAEIAMLARITHAEAEGEPFVGQVGVAASVLNRVMSPNYPATVTEVVYQRISGRYQYSPVADGRIKLEPNEKAWRAAYAALAGWDPTEGATGFFNPAKTRDRWVHSRPATTQIGGHVFFN